MQTTSSGRYVHGLFGKQLARESVYDRRMFLDPALGINQERSIGRDFLTFGQAAEDLYTIAVALAGIHRA